MKILFLCTGNFYRSRLAEEFLRAYAAAKKVDLVSDSAGLGPIPNPINIGPMRREAVDYLKERGIAPATVARFPRKCTVADMKSFDLIIGMNEAEHRHMVEAQFPGIAVDRILYWHVPDMDEDPGYIGPDLMERNVRELLAGLMAHDSFKATNQIASIESGRVSA